MRCVLRVLALVVVSCAVAALPALHAQTPQQPTFRSGVDVVAVDVRAVDGAGRPVTDLRPDDFLVTVDGARRAIVTADFISYPVTTVASAASSPNAARPAPTFTSNDVAQAPGRTVILFMDEENIRSGYGKWAADAAAAFVDHLQPTDRVGLVIPRNPTRIAPTTDHAAVRTGLSHVVGHLAPVAFGDSTGPAWAFDKHYDILKAQGKGQAVPPDLKAETIIAYLRQRALSTLEALTSLLDSLGADPGPKTIVFVSEELPVGDYQDQVAEFNPRFTRLGQAAARAHAMLYVLQLDRPLVDADDVRTATTDQASVSSAHDPSPMRDSGIRSFGLETAVGITGGRRLLVSGKPEAAVQRVALEISGQYLLGMRTEAADRDGKPHRIKVTVKLKGVEVRARQMFTYAPDTVVADKSASDAVNRALRATTAASGIPVSVATYSALEPGNATKMRVAITAEIDRGATQDVPLTVGYALTDSSGRNAGASVEAVTLRPAIGHPDGSLVYVAGAVIPPGSYTLRLAAADSGLRLGAVVHQFEARPIPAGPVTLSDLVVFDRYPAEAGKGRPSVSATVADRLSGYVEAYMRPQAGGAAAANLSARLEVADSADAAPRATGEMTVQGPDANGRLLVAGSADVSGLPAGNYVARVALESTGKRLGQVTRPIQVVPAPVATQRSVAPVIAATPPSTGSGLQASAAAAARVAPSPAGAPATTAAVSSPDASRRAPATTVEDVMSRVAAYIDDYAERMSLVIGSERYSQWLQPDATMGDRPISRQTVAEFALVLNKDDWDGFRNVYEVDGKAVPDAQDRIKKLFLDAPATAIDQSRKIAAESARYNYGALQRNFNVPTVALFFLTRANQGRSRFTKDKDDVVGGVKAWKVKFEEMQKPTLIRTLTGKDMPVKGEAWIDPVDGRVLKTHMQIDAEMATVAPTGRPQNVGVHGMAAADVPTSQRVKTTASVTVTYAVEPKLGLLVPSEMLETYEVPMRSQFSGEDTMTKINCRATYSDFKRFETSGRMLPPK